MYFFFILVMLLKVVFMYNYMYDTKQKQIIFYRDPICLESIYN